MRSSVIKRLLLLGAILVLPVLAWAQEATLSGTVTDTTGGVLPGVTVTALHEASGNTFETVTDERGTYRIPVRTGGYRLTAELQGFATVIRSGLELLLAQQAVVNFQMSPSALQESVTVTAESPLVDVTSSRMSGNVDPRQLSELPLNGRNWQDLSMLAPGHRTNAGGEVPVPREVGTYQLNIDGQQVTQQLAPGSLFGQPRLSRDAIAEFEFVANRFDATQGRSSGVQINAITKSGTNNLSGTFAGYFRHDRFNAADFIQRRVLPYSDQQLSATFGGPIRKDRIHFFGNYEYEREPQTFTYSTPFPRFNIDQTATRREKKGGARLDAQFSPQTRLTVSGNKFVHQIPFDRAGGAIRHPSTAIEVMRTSRQINAALTQVLGNRAVNEVKGGHATYYWTHASIVNWANHPQPAAKGLGSPIITFRGFTIGQGHANTPQRDGQDYYSVRDDFTYSFTKAGRHDLKLGGEYIYAISWIFSCRSCMGQIDAQGGPIPANIEDLFPVWNDASTWNVAALSPIVRRYAIGVGNFRSTAPRHVYAGWVQDDWKVTPRLTLNLGLRYDLSTGIWANWAAIPPFLEAGRPDDTNNVVPRLGFAFSLNDRTVIRGGFGKYFAETTSNYALQTDAFTKLAVVEAVNDRRPDFAVNPFNGPTPTFEQAVRSGQRGDLQSLFSPTAQVPYSYQSSIGVQRQLGDVIAVEADYVFIGARHDFFSQQINLAFNPATGVNYPFTTISQRPYPEWGRVQPQLPEAWSNYHALQTSFTKRFSRRWQASGTYALAGFWDGEPEPLTITGQPRVSFPVVPDLGRQYSLATTDQRHRAVFNGIWQLGSGFQLSGLYFFGSGQRFETTYGGDLRITGQPGGRVRPDDTIVPRNNFVGKPVHRVDVRIQRTFRLAGRAGVDGILEMFNVFNHANYGSYVTVESNRNYGRPSANTAVAYAPRMLQLGFRFAF
jgi:hypothetical protein